MSLEDVFPNLRTSGYTITSPRDPTYNCIAWAANEMDRWWWPNPSYYWPNGVPRSETLEAFTQAYATLGFTPCEDATLEFEYEKIVIYVNSAGIPTHAARQLPNGRWTSKLGKFEDIEHTDTSGLDSPVYGSVAIVLRRHL
ncbi:MAG TPA: hypothetical protein VE398_02575 [Acidobacteriota bacterium]|nr:hypothetical protein [Acidobacteriota bacterium]